MSVRHLDALFRPRGVLVCGLPRDAPAAELLHQLDAIPEDLRAIYEGQRDGWRVLRRLNDARGFDLAVVLDPDAMTPRAVRTLAARGCRALIWETETPVPDAVLRAGRDTTLRVLGSSSAGATHAHGHGISAWGRPLPGTTALIAQSRSIASAALDWAAGHALGFSWTAVTGGEADVDVADLLDYAALDFETQAVVLQLGRIGNARKFMSAARACARAKPVVVLQTPGAAAPQDPVLSAAFRRAGLVEVDRVTALFSALAALDRVGDAPQGRIAVVGTGGGICQLARAALLREGLHTADVTAVHAALQSRIPTLGTYAQTLDLGLADDAQTLLALRTALETPGIDTVLFVRSPVPGRDDDAFAALLAASGLRQRLVVSLLGQARAQPALQRCTEAGIAAFASVEAAARALRYRREHRQTQDLLMQTPTLAPLPHDPTPPVPAPPRRGNGPWTASADTTRALLQAYGLRPADWVEAGSRGLRIRIRRHAEIGLYLSARLDPTSTMAPTAYALPPLDDVLAETLLREAALGAREESPSGLRTGEYATAVARLAQLAVEHPQLIEADVRLLPGETIAEVGHARLTFGALESERRRLALAPYPVALARTMALRDGRSVELRAILPTDEPALIRMLSGLDPETIRLRFFRYIRQFSHAMVARMSQVDYDREIGFVATPVDDEAAIGLATLVLDADGEEGEFAILVHHDYAGTGLGLRLMRALLDYARARRARRVYGDVLLENRAMLGLAQRMGFTQERHPDDPGCLRVSIAL
ncbi:MAG TPA: GNAT family N-acetyltransferase [Solimonas sp.]